MTKYCPKCGAPNPDDALYCSKCGSPLPAAKPPEAAAQPPAPVAPSESKPAPGRRSRAWLWLVIGLVIGLVAAGAPLMLSYNSLQGQYQALNASYTNLQSSYASLQSQYSSLQSSYASLQSQYSSLQSSYNSLHSQYSSFQSSYNSLQSQYQALQSSYASLQNQYSSLQSSYNSLQSQYQALQSSYASLQNQYSSLQSSYNSLQSQYQALQSSYASLQSIANLQQTTTWVNAQTVSEGPSSDYPWSFSTSYAGYVTVTVSSSTTSNTWIEIYGISSNGITYNSYEISVGYSGTVYYPVLPGTVYVYVGNNNLVNGATETVTITYTY